ncbi:MAG: copper homeostasis protein CutC [Planctomycetota bacterium]
MSTVPDAAHLPASRTEPRPFLEIACDAAEDVALAFEHGADRVELCAALEVGGVTPGPGLLLEARGRTALELIVLARPRRGDFDYDASTFRALVRDVEFARDHGADGVAVGVLTADRALDVARTRELVRAAGPLTVTFHRAFDQIPDPRRALAQLSDLGVRRVLTSAGGARAVERARELTALVEAAGPDLQIVAAGGVRAAHVQELLATTPLRAFHASASRLEATGPAAVGLAPSLMPAEHELRRVDLREVAALRAALRGAPGGSPGGSPGAALDGAP